MRQLVYYVAASIDGFIAASDGDTSAFPAHPETLAALFDRYPETCPTHLREALGVTGPARRFDTVLMGARTHAPAVAAGLTSAYPHLRQIVATRRRLPADPSVTAVGGDLATFVADLKAQAGRDLWLCGGGAVAAQLVDLIDELQVKVNPVTLGAGIPLLPTPSPVAWTTSAVEALPGGVTLVTYRRQGDITADTTR